MSPESGIQAELKAVMRVFPQGVTVVTVKSPDGPKGVTVSAFISVSLNPPLVLVSIGKSSAIHQILTNSEVFAVNFLADDQKSISERFANMTEKKFEGVGSRPGKTGSPIINGVRAVVECRKWKVYDGGDHSILIGEVVEAVKLNDKPPLVYYAQDYTTTEPLGTRVPPAGAKW